MLAIMFLASPFLEAKDEAGVTLSGITSLRDARPPVRAEFERDLDKKIEWIISISDHLHLGYKMPKGRPEVYLVSRTYILEHEKEICTTFSDPKEVNNCAKKIFGWIDDERKIYILREEDVESSEIVNGRRGFPVETWVAMELLHELVHYVQMEDSPFVPSTLSCDVEAKWEGEAHSMMQWWLNSLQTIDAGRIIVLLRGGLLTFGCSEKKGEEKKNNI
jgi:hypothetical protein